MQKLAKMTSQWRHINFLGTFLRFLTDFTTCVKISAHLKYFYGNLFFTSIYVILTIFWAKWRHNDVTRKKNWFFSDEFLFYNFLENFSIRGSFLRKLRGVVFAPPPPPVWIGVWNMPLWIGLNNNIFLVWPPYSVTYTRTICFWYFCGSGEYIYTVFFFKIGLGMLNFFPKST